MKYNDEEIWARVTFFGSGTTVGQCVAAFHQVETGQATSWTPDPNSKTLKIPAFNLESSTIGNRKFFLQFAGTPDPSPMNLPSCLLVMKHSDAIVICRSGEETSKQNKQLCSELCDIMDRLQLTADTTTIMILFQKEVPDLEAIAKVFMEGMKRTKRLIRPNDILNLKNPEETYQNITQTVRTFLSSKITL